MGMCGKVCEIYRNISFCRKVDTECRRCTHFKKLCAAGEFCAFENSCPEREKPKMKKTWERMNNNGN